MRWVPAAPSPGPGVWQYTGWAGSDRHVCALSPRRRRPTPGPDWGRGPRAGWTTRAGEGGPRPAPQSRAAPHARGSWFAPPGRPSHSGGETAAETGSAPRFAGPAAPGSSAGSASRSTPTTRARIRGEGVMRSPPHGRRRVRAPPDPRRCTPTRCRLPRGWSGAGHRRGEAWGRLAARRESVINAMM